MAEKICFLASSYLPVSPNPRTNQVQFSCFQPDRPCPRLQLRHSTNGHTKEMLCFARLLLTRADALQKFLLRNGVIGFDIICSHARPCSDKLANDSARQWSLRNHLRKIDDRFPQSRRPF